jgi:hypothetical protein
MSYSSMNTIWPVAKTSGAHWEISWTVCLQATNNLSRNNHTRITKVFRRLRVHLEFMELTDFLGPDGVHTEDWTHPYFVPICELERVVYVGHVVEWFMRLMK